MRSGKPVLAARTGNSSSQKDNLTDYLPTGYPASNVAERATCPRPLQHMALRGFDQTGRRTGLERGDIKARAILPPHHGFVPGLD